MEIELIEAPATRTRKVRSREVAAGGPTILLKHHTRRNHEVKHR